MNNREAMQKAFDAKYEEIGEDVWEDIGNDKIFEFGWNACLASQAQQPNKEKILVDAITEVLRVLETDNEAILDTVWTTRGDNETLWEHCAHVLEQVTGIEYKPAEQLALDLQSHAQQERKPVIAYEVRDYGRMQKIIVRDDVAEEYADKLKADGCENVEVRELVYALPPAPEGVDK